MSFGQRAAVPVHRSDRPRNPPDGPTAAEEGEKMGGTIHARNSFIRV